MLFRKLHITLKNRVASFNYESVHKYSLQNRWTQKWNKNTQISCLYIKISISPIFFSISPLVLCLACGSLLESRRINCKSVYIYSKHRHAKSEDKPLQIQLVLALKIRIQLGKWYSVKKKKEGKIKSINIY